jgi:hypothetical protein
MERADWRDERGSLVMARGHRTFFILLDFHLLHRPLTHYKPPRPAVVTRSITSEKAEQAAGRQRLTLSDCCIRLFD